MMSDLTTTAQILVVYYSRFGVVKRLAECIADGARREEGTAVDLLEIGDRPIEESLSEAVETDMPRRRAAILNRLTSADALVVGAPGYFGSMASPVKRLFEDCATASNPPMSDRSRPWRHFRFHNKVGAAFTSTATPHGGNEETLLSILTMFMHLGMIVVTPGQQQPILENESPPYGATAVAGAEGTHMPTKSEEEVARNLGQRVAQVTTALKLGFLRHSDQQSMRDLSRPYGSDRPV